MYVLTTDAGADAIACDDGRLLRQADLTFGEGTLEGDALDGVLSAWHVHYEQYWHCSARSDSGVDHRETEEGDCTIPPDSLVLQGEDVVGLWHKGHLFLFEDPSTHGLLVTLTDKYVGGWGDVLETEEYELRKGPAPEGAMPLPPRFRPLKA